MARKTPAEAALIAWNDPKKMGNPSIKAGVYAGDLKTGINLFGGESLTDTQKAYRSGYLKAQADNARMYNLKNGLESKAKPRSRGKKEQ